MNILIPEKWLLEQLETEADTKTIQEKLSLCGPSVERVDSIQGDNVFDIEVTTNRVDTASVRGVAREAAAILPEFDIPAQLKDLDLNVKTSSNNPLDIEIDNNPQLCQRIVALTMSIDSVGEPPQWLKTRLEQVGQRSLNTIIDITNYVMWEIGHPIHVFDLDKLQRKRIVVRQAKAGETLITLDNKKHVCRGGEVVFDDGTGTIIDLPGIMGTKNSVVDEMTTNILIWIESVPAKLIRKASMGLAIRTQAAVLNEKHVDPTLGMDAVLRAQQLYEELAGATATSVIYDNWPVKVKPKLIHLKRKLVDTYLGISLPSKQITGILTNLGFSVEESKAGFEVLPPNLRTHDVQIPQDIIEEIARIYGYHRLPSKLMDTPLPQVDTNLNHYQEQQIKSALANWGVNEVYSYSLVSKTLAKQSGYKLQTHLKVKNELTEDLVYLRQSLIPSHNEIFETNKAQTDWTIFEMANTYQKQEGQLPIEKLELVISSNGEYPQLKLLVDTLMDKLRVQDYTVEPGSNPQVFPEFEEAISGEIFVGPESIGVIGQTNFGFYATRLDVSRLISLSKPYPTYQPLSSTSPIIEDMTFVLPEQTHIGLVIDTLTQVDPAIGSVTQKDVYQQNYTFTIEYLDRDVQLSADDIQPLRQKIVTTVKDTFAGTLVGEI